jgi:hypothetical protein
MQDISQNCFNMTLHHCLYNRMIHCDFLMQMKVPHVVKFHLKTMPAQARCLTCNVPLKICDK